MKPSHCLLLSAFLFSVVLQTQTTFAQQYPEFGIDESLTTKHIRFLASDELLGRMTGEQGNQVAARYIAEYFRMYGLQEPAGADGYYQKVPLYKQSISWDGYFIANSDTLFPGVNYVQLSGSAFQRSDVPMMFGDNFFDENGNVNSNFNYKINDEFILVTTFGSKFRQTSFNESLALSLEKRRIAKELGYAAVIEIYEGTIPFRNLAGFLRQDRFMEGNPDDLPSLPHLLVDLSASSPSYFPARSTFSFNLGGVQLNPVKTENVAGIIRGTDPQLRDEFIVLMAHYDHVGAGMRPGISPADTIFNGARDNGMGVVGLLTAAKALSQSPPKRSVLILAVTAEEVGLLGSSYFVRNPLVPLEKIAYVLNIDNGGYNDTSLITLIGHGRTNADGLIAEAVSASGLTLLPDPSPEQNLFNRSDNVHFARVGIPAPTFSAGFTAFDEEIMRYYHRPSDKADENFDFSYLLKFAVAYAHTARKMADAPIRFQWTPGDPYEEAFQRLHQSR